MRQRNALELPFASRRELNKNLPPIHPAARAPHQPAFLQAIHQFDGAVMLDLKPLRKNADGRFLRGRNTFDGKQRLVLLRLKSRCPRVAFTEVQVPANRISAIRQRLEIEAFSAGPQHIRARLYRIPM